MSKIEKNIEDLSFDEERALYHSVDSSITSCRFEGPADGESALKESKRITVSDCFFDLRYPLWHVDEFTLSYSQMTENARAALWYCNNGSIKNCSLYGIKALRECNNIKLEDCSIGSPEFGWKCSDISVCYSDIEAEYVFLDSKNISLSNVQMKGKYSFQYIDGLTIENCSLDTKDAFWHSRNVTVKNSTIKGEYLAWFSQNLTLVNCHIIGTQPLCYCRGLKLIDCTMDDTDLSFEYSDVEASILGRVESIKNPLSGNITVDEVGEIIHDDPVMECRGQVIIR